MVPTIPTSQRGAGGISPSTKSTMGGGGVKIS